MDGDGLPDELELLVGTDPVNPDSDGDSLLDGEELELGTDPLDVDSDDDTYLDGHEVIEGHDPLDPENRIYVGYWPYNPDKDAIIPSESGGTLLAGDILPRQTGADHFGDEVDLYDFAGSDRPEFIVLISQASWHPACHTIGEWLATGEGLMGYEEPYGDIRTDVDEGRVRVITMLVEGPDGGTPSDFDLTNWDDHFHHPNVPVIRDSVEGIGIGAIKNTSYWPAASLVRAETMEVLVVGGPDDAFDGILNGR